MPSCAIIIGSSRCVTQRRFNPDSSTCSHALFRYAIKAIFAGRFSSPRQIQRKSLSFSVGRRHCGAFLAVPGAICGWKLQTVANNALRLSTEIKDSRNRPTNNKANQFLFRLLAALGNLACIMKLFGCAIIFRAQRSSPLVFPFSSSPENCMSLSMAKHKADSLLRNSYSREPSSPLSINLLLRAPPESGEMLIFQSLGI
jgi:hypothetical protein